MATSKSKRDLVLGLLDPATAPEGVPAAFFLHFDKEHHKGRAAVDRHLEYFRATGMDLLKIQYEHPLPPMPGLARPSDWSRVPRYGEEFFRDPLEVVSGLVAEAKREAVVVVTLYSPFMFAGQLCGADTLVRHLEEDPDAVAKGMRIVTDAVLAFARGCMDRGVDGFYASTQGAEVGRFRAAGVFERFIEPFDLEVWDLIERRCPCNILHVCDYHGIYDSLDRFRSYPGRIVSSGLELAGRAISPREAASTFGRPFMGGMDRHGVLATGPIPAIRKEAQAVLAASPERFLLAADCTVPSETPWENLRAAVDTAHAFRRR
jgi:uroporphyrinogen decarboxylase